MSTAEGQHPEQCQLILVLIPPCGLHLLCKGKSHWIQLPDLLQAGLSSGMALSALQRYLPRSRSGKAAESDETCNAMPAASNRMSSKVDQQVQGARASLDCWAVQGGNFGGGQQGGYGGGGGGGGYGGGGGMGQQQYGGGAGGYEEVRCLVFWPPTQDLHGIWRAALLHLQMKAHHTAWPLTAQDSR